MVTLAVGVVLVGEVDVVLPCGQSGCVGGPMMLSERDCVAAKDPDSACSQLGWRSLFHHMARAGDG